MKEDNQRILDKIKRCLALSKSSNENESATALRQAHAMMEKYNISMEDIELSDVNESVAETKATQNPLQYQSYLASVVAKIFGCDVYVKGGFDFDKFRFKYHWVFIGIDIYADITSYAFDVLIRQLNQARRQYMKTELSRVRLAKNRYARADKFCIGWVSSVARLIENLVPPNVNKKLIEQKLNEKNLTTAKALDRVSNSKAQSATNDYYNGRKEGKNAQLHNAMHGSTNSGLIT